MSVGEKKNLINLANQNAKALLQKEKVNFSKRENFLLQLQKTLTLKNYPRYIECFDISNIGRFFRVGSLVVFVNGEKIKEKTLKKYKRVVLKPKLIIRESA